MFSLACTHGGTRESGSAEATRIKPVPFFVSVYLASGRAAASIRRFNCQGQRGGRLGRVRCTTLERLPHRIRRGTKSTLLDNAARGVQKTKAAVAVAEIQSNGYPWSSHCCMCHGVNLRCFGGLEPVLKIGIPTYGKPASRGESALPDARRRERPPSFQRFVRGGLSLIACPSMTSELAMGRGRRP